MHFPHYKSVLNFRLRMDRVQMILEDTQYLSTLLDLEEMPSVSDTVRVWLHETVPAYTKGLWEYWDTDGLHTFLDNTSPIYSYYESISISVQMRKLMQHDFFEIS